MLSKKLKLKLRFRAFKKSKLRLQLRDLIKASASLWLRNLGLRTHVWPRWQNSSFTCNFPQFGIENSSFTCNLVWNGGFKIGKLCGCVCTQKGGQNERFTQNMPRWQNLSFTGTCNFPQLPVISLSFAMWVGSLEFRRKRQMISKKNLKILARKLATPVEWTTFPGSR